MFNCFCESNVTPKGNNPKEIRLSFYNTNSFFHQLDIPLLTKGKIRYKQTEFLFFSDIAYPWIVTKSYQLPKTPYKSIQHFLNVIHIRNISSKNNTTLVFSHQHTKLYTLPHIYPLLVDISTNLKCDVISYDYTEITTENLYNNHFCYDIEQVVYFSKKILKIPYHQMILFGDVFGSIVSMQLCLQPAFKGIKGIILMNPISTGYNIKYQKDIVSFNIKDSLHKINNQLFVIHGGKLNNCININQSKIIVKEVGTFYTWYPSEGNHTNIIKKYRNEFYEKIKFFIKQCDIAIESDREKKLNLSVDSSDKEIMNYRLGYLKEIEKNDNEDEYEVIEKNITM